MRRPWALAAGLIIAGLASTSAFALAKQPYEIVRSLEALHDQMALGQQGVASGDASRVAPARRAADGGRPNGLARSAQRPCRRRLYFERRRNQGGARRFGKRQDAARPTGSSSKARSLILKATRSRPKAFSTRSIRARSNQASAAMWLLRRLLFWPTTIPPRR